MFGVGHSAARLKLLTTFSLRPRQPSQVGITTSSPLEPDPVWRRCFDPSGYASRLAYDAITIIIQQIRRRHFPVLGAASRATGIPILVPIVLFGYFSAIRSRCLDNFFPRFIVMLYLLVLFPVRHPGAYVFTILTTKSIEIRVDVF